MSIIFKYAFEEKKLNYDNVYVVTMLYNKIIETHNSQHVVILRLISEKCPQRPHAMPVRF